MIFIVYVVDGIGGGGGGEAVTPPFSNIFCRFETVSH